MKNLLLVAGLIAVTPLTAFAAQSKNSGVPSAYTCDGLGVTRAALRDSPAPCCQGRMQCAQMLSTQVIIQKRHPNRT
jgi:hypothetical protein